MIMHMNTDTNTPISVAPMMDWTDRHCRYFHRLLSPNARLYTEMVTTGAILHGDTERLLRFNTAEHPVALQLGGSEPDSLSQCAKIGEDFGYDEINLNCGCPSDRVQSGSFGACLMITPDLVARSCEAMTKSVSIPVTVKCRIGIDDSEEYAFLSNFVKTVSNAGVTHFIIHARKAWLKGLSPKENREIPPLRYDVVNALKQEFPELRIEVNGGINTLAIAKELAPNFDGLMIGREAYQNPRFLCQLDGREPDLEDVLIKMSEYAAQQYQDFQTPVKSIGRHMLGLFKDQSGARAWRQYLSQNMHKDDSDHRIFLKAYEHMQESAGRKHMKSA